MENRRHRSGIFGAYLLAVLLVLFLSIEAAVVLHDLKPENNSLMGNWGGTILAMIGMIVSFEFGSSKGSQMKDEALNAKRKSNEPETSPVVTNTVTVDSVRNTKPD